MSFPYDGQTSPFLNGRSFTKPTGRLKDTQGDTVTLTVESYFMSVLRMTNFLPKDAGDWSIDATQHFQSHLREDIRSEMKSNSYMYNAALALKEPYSQLMNLQDC
jgi:hypothetical protein